MKSTTTTNLVEELLVGQHLDREVQPAVMEALGKNPAFHQTLERMTAGLLALLGKGGEHRLTARLHSHRVMYYQYDHCEDMGSAALACLIDAFGKAQRELLTDYMATNSGLCGFMAGSVSSGTRAITATSIALNEESEESLDEPEPANSAPLTGWAEGSRRRKYVDATTARDGQEDS